MLSLVLSACFIVGVSILLQRLRANYLAAKQTGLRIVLAPCSIYNPIWAVALYLFSPVLKHADWARVINFAWHWEDDAKLYEKYGTTFILVTPDGNTVYTCDEVAVAGVLGDRKGFPKPKIYETLNVFGRNVDTVNDAEWALHRKLTAPCFNERISSHVYHDALRQARSLLSSWLSSPSGTVSSLTEDTRIIALHVFLAAGMGSPQDFHAGARTPAPGHALSRADALGALLESVPATLVFGYLEKKAGALASMVGGYVGKMVLAVKEYRQYAEEAIAVERKLLAEQDGERRHNLLSILIRTVDDEKAGGDAAVAKIGDEEIRGNIFIFTLAGHETTANSLAYAFALLALHPEVQAWVDEEVDAVMAGEDGEDGVYEEVYPRLVRVMAVMYETLRLYTQTPIIPRAFLHNTPLPVTPSPSSLDRTHIPLPPNTEIYLNLHGMHTNPSSYPNPTVFDPKRWVITSPSSQESLRPAPLFFAPWASGPRVCPGKKFAQVEFAAVLGSVLKKVWVKPCKKGGGGGEEARKDVWRCLRRSEPRGATLKMMDEVWLKVERR